MRTVGLPELEAFSDAVEGVRVVCARFGPLCTATPQVMSLQGLDDALRIGVRVAADATEELYRAHTQFERAVRNFLGEGRRHGESIEDCFTRICAMTEAELLATPRRNGLVLRL